MVDMSPRDVEGFSKRYASTNAPSTQSSTLRPPRLDYSTGSRIARKKTRMQVV